MESALIVPNAVILETRQLWWNIDAPFAKILFYFLILVSTGILIHGVYKKILIITAGKFPKGENRFSDVWNRLVYVFTYAFLHKKTSQKKTPGLAHHHSAFHCALSKSARQELQNQPNAGLLWSLDHSMDRMAVIQL